MADYERFLATTRACTEGPGSYSWKSASLTARRTIVTNGQFGLGKHAPDLSDPLAFIAMQARKLKPAQRNKLLVFSVRRLCLADVHFRDGNREDGDAVLEPVARFYVAPLDERKIPVRKLLLNKTIEPASHDTYGATTAIKYTPMAIPEYAYAERVQAPVTEIVPAFKNAGTAEQAYIGLLAIAEPIVPIQQLDRAAYSAAIAHIR